MPGASSIGTLSEDGGEVIVSPSEVPVTVAVLSMEPWVTSAAVTV